MKKLYTEKQYNHYCKLLQEMANEDDMIANYGIHLEIENWFKEQGLSRAARDEMDQRMEDEEMGRRPTITRIK